MSSQLIRPWLNTAARCSRYSLPKPQSATHLRTLTTEAPRRLETVEDWAELTQHREQLGLLINQLSKYGSDQIPNTSFKPSDSLHKPQAQGTLSTLLAAGAHFGHASTRMNPNFMPYAYGTRAGITIIDLDQTLPLLRRAANLVRAVAKSRGSIIFIGTRPDLQPIVQKASRRLGKQGYSVGDRWLPGTLTNRRHFFGNDVDKVKAIPDLAIILNPMANMSAIRECAAEHVPTIGIIDSNVDPRIVMYPIPANDENTRTAELVAGVLSIAGREGVAIADAEAEKNAEIHAKRLRQRRGSSYGLRQ
ncbi:ribosomal protein S2 [Macrolepiota fuliginosa MF-IS2]|uniref:Ribosomal protein S2 n=1 Tax=Macrolepiota fuliginosa MF-IS2 TaxID=1400762 RepID=A0A9P5XMF6_9AGAR|nr:ribosomal protein S2 [Macrolepiota fuliginosa MF-IS2]